MKASLLNALRKGTRIAIRIDSHPIVLTPHLTTASAGGVYNKVPQTPRESQNFAIENISSIQGPTRTEGATMHLVSFELVGPWDSEMAVGDTWIQGTTQYRVHSMAPANGYEVRGICAGIGKDPSYGS